MKTKARKSCPNCRRLQARLEALEATVARLQEQLAAARKNSATSSKPPSSDIVKPPKPPLPEGQDRRSIGGQPGHPKHERDPFPPEAVNAGVLRSSHRPLPSVRPRVANPAPEPAPGDPAGRHPRAAPVDSGASWSSRVVPLLPEALRGFAADRDQTRRLGRAQADHRDRLPQGGLSRILLDHPQVHPRCRPLDHLARTTGGDHRQGEPGPGAALSGTAGSVCRTKSDSTSTRPVTSRTASTCGPGAFERSCTRCSRSTRREARTC